PLSPLSLHDALPIWTTAGPLGARPLHLHPARDRGAAAHRHQAARPGPRAHAALRPLPRRDGHPVLLPPPLLAARAAARWPLGPDAAHRHGVPFRPDVVHDRRDVHADGLRLPAGRPACLTGPRRPLPSGPPGSRGARESDIKGRSLLSAIAEVDPHARYHEATLGPRDAPGRDVPGSGDV